MPKNRHFNFTDNIKEQCLISSLKKEAIEVFGQDMYYIQRESVDFNHILGEDLMQEFKDATLLVIYPETVENFGGNKEFMAKFGFSLQDTTNLLVHKDEFKLVPNRTYPQAGDLILWPVVNRLFQITFVDIDYQFYQLGKNSVYQLQCELFKYASENIDTNVEEVDAFDIFNNDDSIENDPSDVDNTVLQNKQPSWLPDEQ